MNIVQEYSKKGEISWYDIKKTMRTFFIVATGQVLSALVQIAPNVGEYLAGRYDLDEMQLLVLGIVFSGLVDAFRRTFLNDYSNDKYGEI